MSRRLLASFVLATLIAGSAVATDLYGKPLRGLSPVTAKAVVAEPARYAGKTIRVEGANAGAAGRPALKEEEAVLPIVTDGTFTIPENLTGGFLAAEGRARAQASGAVFVATGIEVRREAVPR